MPKQSFGYVASKMRSVRGLLPPSKIA